MFFGPGEIRAVLTGFKTTKTGIAFQRVIKTNLDTFFELIDKYFKPKDLSPDIHKNSIIDIEAIDKAVKKTGQYIKVNAYKAEKKIDKLIGNNQPATTNKAPQVSSLITSNADEAKMIVESIDNVLDNHVKNIDNIIENPKSPYVKFSGGHTKKAFDNYIEHQKSIGNYASHTEDKIIHSNGLIEYKFEMTDINGKIHKKNGNGGYSTLFPEDWSNEKIKEEVLHSLKNAQRTKNDMFTGHSKNENIKIQFIIENNKIKTIYPIVE